MLADLSSITIPETRQRREFDPLKITELANSIAARGLLHPIVVRGEPPILVAGERRLRAIQQLAFLTTPFRYNGEVVPPGKIPVSFLVDLSPLEIEEAELEENTVRVDLSWQERTQAEARLHNLRSQQNPAQTTTQTAEEIYGRGDGAYGASVRENVIVAKHLDKPEIAKAKSAKEAFKLLKIEEKKARDQERAKFFGKELVQDRFTLLNADCLDALPEGMFDCIIADPPYGINAHNFGDSAGRMTSFSHDYDDSPENWQTLMQAFVPRAFNALRSQGHCYIFCDLAHYHELKELCETSGFYVTRTPLIHHKPNSGRVPVPNQSFRRTYELILFANKGKKLVETIFDDVISTRSDGRAEDSTHGASKPVEVYLTLLRASCRPGDIVCDPFAGSGTILHAAQKAKLYAWAIEKNPTYYGHCIQVLKEI